MSGCDQRTQELRRLRERGRADHREALDMLAATDRCDHGDTPEPNCRWCRPVQASTAAGRYPAWGNPVEPVGGRRDGHQDATVRDGYWIVPCEDGCNGIGSYDQPTLPDYGDECRACKGTGYKIVALAAPTGLAPTVSDPVLDLVGVPDLAHGEHDNGLGEVLATDELLDPLAAHAKALSDLGAADEVMHGADHKARSEAARQQAIELMGSTCDHSVGELRVAGGLVFLWSL